MTMQPIDVPAGTPREPTAAERFAARQPPQPPPAADDAPDGEGSAPAERLVSLRAVTDTLSMLLIVCGLSVGDASAWLAGGRVPGLATLGGALIVLGLLLTL